MHEARCFIMKIIEFDGRENRPEHWQHDAFTCTGEFFERSHIANCKLAPGKNTGLTLN